MRSAFVRILGGGIILCGAILVGRAETPPGEEPPLLFPETNAKNIDSKNNDAKHNDEIVNPVSAVETEQHPVVDYAPLTTPCTRPVLSLSKTAQAAKDQGVVRAKAEEPVVAGEAKATDQPAAKPAPAEKTPTAAQPVPALPEKTTTPPAAKPISTEAKPIPPAAQPIPTETKPTPPAAQPVPAAPVAVLPDPAPGSRAPEAKAGPPEKSAPAAEPLKPVPEADPLAPVPLEVVSFKGVTPGASTIEEVEKAWGSPKEISKQDEMIMHRYAVEPFDHVEVSFIQDKVTSVVVRFNQELPVDKVARQLGLNIIRPVLVSNDLGEILGQVYPERGVLLAFAPSEEKAKPSMKVMHIILEPINAEAFVLRAETDLSARYEPCLKDLEIALKLDPRNARANWLAARVLAAMEQFRKAETAAAEAVRLEPGNPRYHLTRAQILGQMGRLDEALAEVEKAIESSRELPHVHARAQCLLGDLTASGEKPDYRKALAYHTQALQTADRAADSPHPAIRVAAKEVLVDAHLGAAHDIAWGQWKGKDKAVTRWVERAIRFAEDLVQNEGGSADQLFRVYARGLAASVSVGQGIDIQPWIGEALRTGKQRIDAASDPLRKAQCEWDLGLALYDAMQIYQVRADQENASKIGKSAVAYLESGYERKQTPEAAYLLGRLYFRLGAIAALDKEDHQAAVVWFDKAVPLLTRALHTVNVPDPARHGETFVSMAVSYWELSQQKKAVQLTERGIELMEKAVEKKMLDPAALAVPYGNLAAMHRRQGAAEDADKYQAMAAKAKETKMK